MIWNEISQRAPINWSTSRSRITALSLFLALLAQPGLTIGAETPKPVLVDLGQFDKIWKGYQALAGYRLEVVADDALAGSVGVMAMDDSGHLYVTEGTLGARTFDVWETIAFEDGSKIRLQKRRKSSFDQIKRLTDADHDGRFETSEVVVEGIENPTALLWTRTALYATALGRLERWKDEDGDGQYESRTCLIDGFGALDARGLTGLTRGLDGYLYLTTGDNENRPFAADGLPIPLSHTGGLFRCRLDGSNLQMLASGFRQPRGGVTFDANFLPILLDDDGADGSRMAGVRMIQPSEAGDYGWLTLTSRPTSPDLELGAVDGERPGRLAAFARLAGAAPTSLVAYNGSKLGDEARGMIIAADPARHSIRGFKLGPTGNNPTLAGEITLVSTTDGRFLPEQVLVGPDSAVYILDRSASSDETASKLSSQHARILRLTWQSGTKAAADLNEKEGKPTHSKEKDANAGDPFATLTLDQLIAQGLANPDQVWAGRALGEMVARGSGSRGALMAAAGNATLPTHARLLGIQGARQFWNDEAEGAMVYLLGDQSPEVRRLAAQVLAWEPSHATARLIPKLLDRLDDSDGRVVREVALAVARHAQTNPTVAAPKLIRWLSAHPTSDQTTRDAVLRAAERLGDVGAAEVALGVRTKRGTDREQAVRLFAALRSSAGADELASLIKIPDLSSAERGILIRQYADFSLDLRVSLTPLVEWLVRHPELEPSVKLAALETCRLAGHPASALVLALLEDEAESVRVAAMLFAGRTRPPGAMSKVADVVADDTKSDMERLAATQSLRWGGPAGFAVLDAAYLNSESGAIRRAALRSMADADRARALPALTSSLAGPDPLIRANSIAILGETSAGAVAVGQAYLDATLNRDDLPMVLRALDNHATRESRPMLASVKQNATQGSSALTPGSIQNQAQESGNPWSGIEVFFRGTSRCASCHQVGGRGGKTGPALDVAAHGLDAARLIEAIQHPNRSIKSGYEPTRLAMATDHPVLKTGPLAGIDRKAGDPDLARSLAMPSGLDLTLTTREFADLVTFLLDTAAQAAVKQGGYTIIDQWAVAGPFALGGDSLGLPLDKVDLTRPLAGLEGRPITWLPLAAMPATGRMDLGGLFALEPSRVYAATQVRSPSAQTAWLAVSTRGPARVYLNGTKVADSPDHAITESGSPPTDMVKVALKAGANLIMVAFDSPATGEPLAWFHLAAPTPVKFRTP